MDLFQLNIMEILDRVNALSKDLIGYSIIQ